MEHSENKIKCPDCGFDIDVNAVLYHQEKDKYTEQYNLLEEEKKNFEIDRDKQNEIISTSVEKKMIEEKKLLEINIKKAPKKNNQKD